MRKDVSEERFVEQKVTYTLEIDGRFIIVENVPARVSERTGERFFSPETVRIVQTPVFEFPSVR